MNDQNPADEKSQLSEIPLDGNPQEDNQSPTTATPSITNTTDINNQSAASVPVTSQPKSPGGNGSGSKGFTRVSLNMPFDEAHSERDWSSPMCSCRNNKGSCLWMCCCWPYYRYTVSTRLGETPFMPLIPCAAFALRVKMRALFSIKGSLIRDFFTSLCCEPCVVCQMTRELDSVGL